MHYHVVVQVNIDVDVDASSVDEAEAHAIRVIQARVPDGYDVTAMLISDVDGHTLRWTHRE